MLTTVLIDGPHIYAMSKMLNINVDFKRLLEYFHERGPVLRVHYFTTVLPAETTQTLRPLLDYLEYNGYTVIEKLMTESVTDAGRARFKGSMAVEIVVTAMELARTVEEVILVAGDRDYCALIESLKRSGVRVVVISTMESNVVADELRRAADQFIDLINLRPALQRIEKEK
jgi:uncharacterized LabA/DUF88 family protein